MLKTSFGKILYKFGVDICDACKVSNAVTCVNHYKQLSGILLVECLLMTYQGIDFDNEINDLSLRGNLQFGCAQNITLDGEKLLLNQNYKSTVYLQCTMYVYT